LKARAAGLANTSPSQGSQHLQGFFQQSQDSAAASCSMLTEIDKSLGKKKKSASVGKC